MSSRKALSISVFLAASVSPFHTMAQEGAAAAPVRVRAVEVARQRVTQTVHVTGEIRARFQTDLSFRVAGRIVERSVDVGDTVRTGDVLARLDADEQAADTAVARADLESAKAAFNQARLEYRRRENLLQTQVITRAAMEEAQKVLDSASENVIAAEARLASAVDANSYTYLRANSPGVVTAKMAEVGQVAQIAQPIFTLAHDGSREAVFDVQESLYLEAGPDPQVSVSLLSDKTKRTPGMIREVSPAISPLTGTIAVKVELGTSHDLPLGAPVSGEFALRSRDAIEVPWSSLTSNDKGAAVWVIDPASQTVLLRSIKIARHTPKALEVASGLKAGDLVVVDGGKFLSSGRRVMLVPVGGE